MLANLLDRYDRKARLAPAMLVALPLALVLFAIGWVVDQALLGAVAGVLIEFGVPIGMANYTRTMGKSIEAGLWDSWGGPPTTQLLRHRGNTNPHRRTLAHARLTELVPEAPVPSAADEETDTDDADRRWEAIVEAARSRLRDQPGSRLLFEENCSYGFHRNMVALRALGTQLAAISAASAIVGGIVQARSGVPPTLLVLAVGAAAAAWAWHKLPDSHVRRAANSYGEAFVGALLASELGSGWEAPSAAHDLAHPADGGA